MTSSLKNKAISFLEGLKRNCCKQILKGRKEAWDIVDLLFVLHTRL